MTFALTPASPFTAGLTVIPASVLNAWRVAINQAIDGTGGGTYSPLLPITINGNVGVSALAGTIALSVTGAPSTTSVGVKGIGGSSGGIGGSFTAGGGSAAGVLGNGASGGSGPGVWGIGGSGGGEGVKGQGGAGTTAPGVNGIGGSGGGPGGNFTPGAGTTIAVQANGGIARTGAMYVACTQVGPTSGTVSVDPTAQDILEVTANGALTLSIQTPPSNLPCRLTIRFMAASTGQIQVNDANGGGNVVKFTNGLGPNFGAAVIAFDGNHWFTESIAAQPSTTILVQN